jgi:O-antigen/teichoic acid export membrane protein
VPVNSQFPSRANLFRWTSTLLRFASVQVVVQCVGFATGILIVRTLPKSDYALYTLALTTVALLSSLSDLGIGNALLVKGGAQWRDRRAVGRLVASALKLRSAFFSAAALIAGSMLLYLCMKRGFSVLQSALILPLVLASSFLQLNYTVWATVLRLRSQIKKLQWLDLGASLCKFSFLLAAIRFVSPAVALTTSGMALAIQTTLCKRWAKREIEPDQPTNEERSSILQLVRSQAPNAIFYCFYSQSAALAISFFGNKSAIADVGALSRLGLITAVFSSLVTNIVLPAFARARTRADSIFKYCLVVAAFLIGASLLILATAAYPVQLVSVLGGRYASLYRDAVWLMISAFVPTFAGLIWAMNAARGWVKRGWLSIPIIIASQVLAAQIFDLSTVRGALLFGALPELSGLFVMVPLAVLGLKSVPLEIPV